MYRASWTPVSRIVTATAATVALAASLAGCGGTGPTPAATGSQGRVLITIPTWWAPKQEMPPTQALFNKQFGPTSGIQVKLQYVAQNLFAAKIVTAASSGRPYPVISVASSFIPQFVHAGVLQPLNGFIRQSHLDLQSFLPGVIKQVTYHGKIYGLSNDQGGFYLYYNQSLFKKAHLPYPGAHFTWTQMLADAKKLTTANHSVWGLDFTDVATGFPDLWLRMNGQYLFNPTVTRVNLTSPAAQQALVFAHNLIFRYHVAPPVSSNAVPALNLFANGDVAMMIGGSWGVDYLRYVKPAFGWNIAPLPVGPSASRGVINPLFNGTYVMSAGLSKAQQAAAWKVLQFYASPTFADHVMGRHLSSLPALKAELTHPSAYDLWPTTPPQAMTQSFETTYLQRGHHIRYYRYNFNAALTSELNQIGEIFSVNKNPQPLLTTVQHALNSTLSTMPWATAP